MNKERKIVVISGPSGVGKTTLCDKLLKEVALIKPCITATTRKPRPDEVDGRDYYFVSQRTFKEWISKDELVEYTTLFGDFYGTPKKSLEAIFQKGNYPLLRIDVTGAGKLKKLGYQGLFIFILPPDDRTLTERLTKRQTAMVDMEKRLARAREELKYQDDYEFKVVNDDITRAVEEIKKIIANNLEDRL